MGGNVIENFERVRTSACKFVPMNTQGKRNVWQKQARKDPVLRSSFFVLKDESDLKGGQQRGQQAEQQQRGVAVDRGL